MTWHLWVALALGIIAFLAGAAAWSAHVEHVDRLTTLGRRYGVTRWPEESLDDFQQRIRNRIIIKGE